MDLSIRGARSDDRGPIAELMYSSGKDVYDYLYGSEAVAFLQHEFVSGRGFAGYPHVTVAVLEGQVVATGCFYDREIYRQHSGGSLKNMFRYFGVARALPVLSRARHLGSVMRRPKPGELYLSNFGVAAQLRGRGIGSRLIAARLAQARAQSYRLFGLDVSSENPRGEALYTRLGLVVTKQKEFSHKQAAVAPVRKMEMAL